MGAARVRGFTSRPIDLLCGSAVPAHKNKTPREIPKRSADRVFSVRPSLWPLLPQRSRLPTHAMETACEFEAGPASEGSGEGARTGTDARFIGVKCSDRVGPNDGSPTGSSRRHRVPKPRLSLSSPERSAWTLHVLHMRLYFSRASHRQSMPERALRFVGRSTR